MPNASLTVHVKSILPMDNGSAVFLGNGAKTIVILIDTYVAHLMIQAMQDQQNTRPTTHELMGSVFLATGCRVERLVINDVNEGQFFARLILTMRNEIREMKIMEIDCRPSDGIILALRNKAPILCSDLVWEKCEDVSKLLTKLTAQSPLSPLGEGGPPNSLNSPDAFNSYQELDSDDDCPF